MNQSPQAAPVGLPDQTQPQTVPAMHPTKNLSRLEKPAPQKDLPPTDVGLVPWLQVLGGFFLMFNSWGIVVSYGTFQTYYTAGGITDENSPSVIAWIGSIQAFMLLFGGALGGKFFDAGYFRVMVWTGSLMVVFGMMMLSLATKYYQFMLAQGLCVGGGTAFLLIPSVGLPGTWFSKRRGLAVGLVTTGSSIGGIVYPIMLHRLTSQIGFPWAARSLGFVSLGTLAISLSVLRQRLPPRKRGTFVEYQALSDAAFAFYVMGIFVTFLGFFTFYGFVEAWAIANHVDTKGLPVFYLLPIINAASTFGRVIPNFISDYVGPLNMQAPAIAVAGLMVLLWIPTHEIVALLVITILYGFFSGALVSLPPTAVARMTDDLKCLGGRLGVVFIAMSISSLIGTPATGAIIQSQRGTYDGARIWSGVVMLAGSIFLVLSRMLRTNWKLSGKV